MSELLEYQECYHRPAHASVINAIALSQDGRRLVTGSDDSTVIVWSTQNGSVLCRIKARSPVLSLVWVRNSSGFLFGCEDGRLACVDLSKYKTTFFTAHDAALSCISPTFNDIFPISAAGEDVQIWTRTGHWQSEQQMECWELKVRLASPGIHHHHQREVEVTSVNWESRDAAASASHVLVSYRWHGIMCWDVPTKSVLWRMDMDECATLSLSPNGNFAATFGLSKAFEVQGLRSSIIQRLQWQGPMTRIPALEPHHAGKLKMGETQDKPVKDKPVCFAHEGFAVVGAASGNKAHVWDAERGDELLSLDHGEGSKVHSLTTAFLHEEDKFLIITGTEKHGKNYVFVWATVPRRGTTRTAAAVVGQRIELGFAQGFWVNIFLFAASAILWSWWKRVSW